MNEDWDVPDGVNKNLCGEEVFKQVLIRLGLISSLSLMKSLPFDVYECATASDEDWDCLRDAFTSEQAQGLRKECRSELMKEAGVYENPDKKSNTEKNRKKREKRKAKKLEKKKIDKLEEDSAEMMTREITIGSKNARIERQTAVIYKLSDKNEELKKKNQELSRKIAVMQAVSKVTLDKLEGHMDTLKEEIDNTSRCNSMLLYKLVEEGFDEWLKENGQTYNYEMIKS